MPTENPRINIVLDKSLYQNVRSLAQRDNVSLSAKAKALIQEALEIQEDIALSDLAEKREKAWDNSEALTHDGVWS